MQKQSPEEIKASTNTLLPAKSSTSTTILGKFSSKKILSIHSSPHFLAFLILCNIPYVIQFLISDFPYGFIWKFFRTLHLLSQSTLLVLLSYAAPSFIANRYISVFLKILLILANLAMFFTDSFCVLYYGIVMRHELLVTSLACTFKEAGEFLIVYIFQLRIIGIVAVVLTALYAVLSAVTWVVKRNSVYLFLIAFALAFSLPITPSFLNRNNVPRGVAILTRTAFELVKLSNIASKTTFKDVEIKYNSPTTPYFVLILGESTQRGHLSLYGNHLLTNPHLQARRDNGSLYVFDDIVAPHAYTQGVLRKLFSFARRENAAIPWYNQANLIDILNAAGYHTVWLSNQETLHSRINVGQMISSHAHTRHYTTLEHMFDGGETKTEVYDEVALPYLDHELSLAPKDKNFFVVHLEGTHFQYKQRYPGAFNKFSAVDADGDNEVQRQIRAEYANAVLYNDHVVNEIMKRFEDKEALVLYLSDHGDEVYDNPRHPFVGHVEYPASKWMVEVPMMFWTSQSFASNHKTLVERIARSTHRRYMTDDLIHTILDILNLHTEDYDPRLSIINDVFDNSRFRIYSDGKAYDSR